MAVTPKRLMDLVRRRTRILMGQRPVRGSEKVQRISQSLIEVSVHVAGEVSQKDLESLHGDVRDEIEYELKDTETRPLGLVLRPSRANCGETLLLVFRFEYSL